MDTERLEEFLFSLAAEMGLLPAAEPRSGPSKDKSQDHPKEKTLSQLT